MLIPSPLLVSLLPPRAHPCFCTVSSPVSGTGINSFSSYSGYAFLAAGLCCGLRSVVLQIFRRNCVFCVLRLRGVARVAVWASILGYRPPPSPTHDLKQALEILVEYAALLDVRQCVSSVSCLRAHEVVLVSVLSSNCRVEIFRCSC